MFYIYFRHEKKIFDNNSTTILKNSIKTWLVLKANPWRQMRPCARMQCTYPFLAWLRGWLEDRVHSVDNSVRRNYVKSKIENCFIIITNHHYFIHICKYSILIVNWNNKESLKVLIESLILFVWSSNLIW